MRRRQQHQVDNRRGSVLVLAAGLLVLVFAFAAFTVDLGLISVTKSQLQNAADAAAHTATMELNSSFGAGAPLTNAAARIEAESAATVLVNKHRSGDRVETPFTSSEDMRFGNRSWNAVEGRWDLVWDATPYNTVEVRVRRSRANDTSLPMAFARVLGTEDREVAAKATAAIMPGVGFDPPTPGGTVDLLPFTVDLFTWDEFMTAYSSGTWTSLEQSAVNHMFCAFKKNGNGNSGGGGSSAASIVDQYHYDADLGRVVAGGDGIPELNIYPDLNSNLPPGNRGTVDLGNPNNSTNDLKRQILDGLNAYDFSFFPGGIRLDQGPLYLNGDTGISAGIQSSLSQIIGDVRAIPIFISVSGPGNNAQYLIVKFVGIRVMAAKLSGGPGRRYLYVEPAPFFSADVIRGDTDFSADSIMTAPVLIRNL